MLYKREVTIDNTSNSDNLTDYQVKIELNSTNFDFTHASNDGNDVRFKDSDDTTYLYYWIEKWDSSNQEAILWVKVPSIPASSNKTIYMYHGDTSGGYTSNGDNTFDFFDGFDGTEIDTNKWDIKGSSSNLTLSNSILDIHITEYDGSSFYKISNGIVSKNNEIEVGQILEARSKGDSAKRSRFVFVGANGNDGVIHPGWSNTEKGFSITQTNTTPDAYTESYDTERKYTSLYDISYSNWHIYRIDYIDADTLKFYIDNALKATHTGSYVPSIARKPVLGGCDYQDTNFHITYDWVRVRKYTDPEPTITVGNEEEATSIYISGQVTLSGNPVQGAIVRAICQDDETYAKDNTTDENGNYMITGLDITKKYHIVVEYTDPNTGQKYNAESKWNITPIESSS